MTVQTLQHYKNNRKSIKFNPSRGLVAHHDVDAPVVIVCVVVAEMSVGALATLRGAAGGEPAEVRLAAVAVVVATVEEPTPDVLRRGVVLLCVKL